VLFFEDDALAIDRMRIDQLLDKASASYGKKYKLSIERREDRKRKTAAMYKDWQNEYLKLCQEYPDTVRYPDRWIAKQFSGMECAHGKELEAIRRRMKDQKSWTEFFLPTQPSVTC